MICDKVKEGAMKIVAKKKATKKNNTISAIQACCRGSV